MRKLRRIVLNYVKDYMGNNESFDITDVNRIDKLIYDNKLVLESDYDNYDVYKFVLMEKRNKISNLIIEEYNRIKPKIDN